MKFFIQICWVIALSLLVQSSRAAGPAVVESLKPGDLIEYEEQPEEIQALIEEALSLTERNLYYRFGSNSPDSGGMDCSGAVQYTLNASGVEEVPRSSYKMYQWAKEQGELVPTPGATTIEDEVFDALQPGDLLFWEGTYDTGDRDPPISHVMIFLGHHKLDGMGIMFGSSDGRHYRRKRINGVSVFDWRVPRAQDSSKFVGYGPIPGLMGGDHDEESDVSSQAPSASSVPTSDDGKGRLRLKSVLEKVFKKPEASTP